MRSGRTGLRASCGGFVWRVRRPLPQPLVRICVPRGILGGHSHLDWRGDGGLRDLHGATGIPRYRPSCGWPVFSLVLFLLNLRDVGDYGRFEYWFAMVKVVTIAAFVLSGSSDCCLSGTCSRSSSLRKADSSRGYARPFLAMTFAIYAFGGSGVCGGVFGRVSLPEWKSAKPCE